MALPFFSDYSSLHVQTFAQSPEWRHLEEVTIDCNVLAICNDLAAVTVSLKFLKLNTTYISGEALQAILVANPGLQVLRLISACMHSFLCDDVKIIGNYGENLRHIYVHHDFQALDIGNLVDLVGKESKLRSMTLDYFDCFYHLNQNQITAADFRRLFDERNPQYLGKGDDYISVPTVRMLASLKTAFPDRNWRVS